MHTINAKLKMRPYQTDQDYWRIREFLRLVFRQNGLRQRSWDIVRWDYWRWHVNENLLHLPLETSIAVWEDAGAITAVLNPDNPGEVFLQVHPEARSPELENEMLEVAESRLAVPAAGGGLELQAWANADDPLRQRVLQRRGYTKGDWPEYQRRRSLGTPIPEVQIAPGYAVRALGEDELPARSLVSWQAFHPDAAPEEYQGWEWYPNVQRIPLYRRDLDLVAVAPGGEFAAFCTVWFDDVNRVGVFEPVGTAPDHQRRGLGKAVMTEGLRRLERLGATMAYVGSYSDAAGALYASVGFTEYDLLERWIKRW